LNSGFAEKIKFCSHNRKIYKLKVLYVSQRNFIKKEQAPPIFHSLKWQNMEPHRLNQSNYLNTALRAGAKLIQAIITIYVDSNFEKWKLIRRDFIARDHSAVVAITPIFSTSSFRDIECVGILSTIPPGASPSVVG
jgi:hypothetical protein